MNEGEYLALDFGGSNIRISLYKVDKEKIELKDERSFSFISIICSVGLVFFACMAMLKTKENVVIKQEEKFTFGKVIQIAKGNDQLLTFMLFAMLSNTAHYMISGVGVYFFDVVVGDAGKQSLFNTLGAVGSILGLAVIPIGMTNPGRAPEGFFTFLILVRSTSALS